MSISIIGAGRLGRTLGRELQKAGHQIDMVVTKHRASARRAGAAIGAVAVEFPQLVGSGDAVERLCKSDLLIISTPDDAIEAVTAQVAAVFRERHGQARRGGKVVLHTSGALSSEILEPFRAAGYAIGSFHPLVSVANDTSTGKFRGAYFCVEGEQRAMQVARTIARQFGGHSFSIASASKPLYHAAAAISSGHLIAVFDLATEMLVRCGISPRRAQAILLPLVQSTVTNLAAKGPAKALTGPLARGDFATVKKHLTAMKTQGPIDALEIYASIGKRALRLAKDLSAEPGQRERIAKLLTSRDGKL